MNLKLFDAYRIINSRILAVTLEYLGDIRVGWCVSYGVFPSLSCCDELSFSLWVFIVIGLNTFMDLRTLDICLAIEYSWWQWGIVFIHLIYWHSTRGFPRWHWGNLCIGVDAHSCLCFSGGNLGALFEVLRVGLSIMNLKLFDAYRIINSRILVVTLEYLGDIRVGWCVSYGVILVRTLG